LGYYPNNSADALKWF